MLLLSRPGCRRERRRGVPPSLFVWARVDRALPIGRPAVRFGGLRLLSLQRQAPDAHHYLGRDPLLLRCGRQRRRRPRRREHWWERHEGHGHRDRDRDRGRDRLDARPRYLGPTRQVWLATVGRAVHPPGDPGQLAGTVRGWRSIRAPMPTRFWPSETSSNVAAASTPSTFSTA